MEIKAKVYKTPEEKIDAMRQAIELCQNWENAIREGLSREEQRRAEKSREEQRRDGGDRFEVT